MLKKIILLVMVFTVTAFAENLINLRAGESKVLQFKDLSKVSIVDPAIADVMAVSDHELLVMAKNVGLTTLYVWMGSEMQQYQLSVSNSSLHEKVREAIGKDIEVIVAKEAIILKGVVDSEDEKKTAEEIAKVYSDKVTNSLRIADRNTGKRFMNLEQEVEELIGIKGVKVKIRDKKLILDGEVSNQNDVNRAMQVASVYSEKVINLLRVNQPYQIMIEAKVIDISKNSTESLGVDWGSDITAAHLSTGNAKGLFPFAEKRDANITSDDNLKIGSITRYYNVMGTLKALIEEGKAKIISSPTMMTMSGISANLTVGGRVPVRSTTVSNNSVTENFTYEQYGLTVNITPEVEANHNVMLDLSIDITDLQYGQTKDNNQNVVPEFLSRNARSIVTCANSETIVISGLIRERVDQNNDKIPVLSKIPGLGKLFHNNINKKTESELLILLTPHVIRAGEFVEKVTVQKAAEVEVPVLNMNTGKTKTVPKSSKAKTVQNEEKAKASQPAPSLTVSSSPAFPLGIHQTNQMKNYGSDRRSKILGSTCRPEKGYAQSGQDDRMTLR
ncbi:MAG: pilus assembly protein N-terminal domain-containing protein [Candidatus Wallbacteria bacterium]|nr:pilus assembly protein N-terminal domain-containing protein [Candidatus Wallbacteria bacterium]